MSSRTRRRLLQSIGGGLPAVAAGCLTRSQTAPTRIEHLRVLNFDHEAHTVHVEITEATETVYDSAVEVPPADAEATDWGDGGWGEGVFEEYPTEPGAYVIHAYRGAQTEDHRRTLDLGAYDHDCAEVGIHVGDPDQPEGTAELSIWRTFDCRTDE